MDAKWQFVFYALGVALFLVDSAAWRPRTRQVPRLQSLGLALVFFPFAYGAAVAGW